MVLVELLNSFGDSPFRRAVAGMVLKLRNDRNVRIVPQTPEQFESALRRYKQAADKSWKAFGSDPNWKTARDASEADGKIVEKVERVWMTLTDYSPQR